MNWIGNPVVDSNIHAGLLSTHHCTEIQSYTPHVRWADHLSFCPQFKLVLLIVVHICRI